MTFRPMLGEPASQPQLQPLKPAQEWRAEQPQQLHTKSARTGSPWGLFLLFNREFVQDFRVKISIGKPRQAMSTLILGRAGFTDTRVRGIHENLDSWAA